MVDVCCLNIETMCLRRFTDFCLHLWSSFYGQNHKYIDTSLVMSSFEIQIHQFNKVNNLDFFFVFHKLRIISMKILYSFWYNSQLFAESAVKNIWIIDFVKKSIILKLCITILGIRLIRQRTLTPPCVGSDPTSPAI